MLHFASGVAVGLVVAIAATTHTVGVRPALPPGAPAADAPVDRGQTPWWECSLNHTLQQNGALVRCYKPGKVTDVVPACGVGHALVLNLSGNRDRCRNMSGGLLDYTCQIGYSPVILTGQDVCRHKAPDEYIPPIRPAGGLY